MPPQQTAHPARGVIVLLALGALATAAFSARAQPPEAPRADRVRAHVEVVVIGDFPSAWLEPVRRQLEADLDVAATVRERAFGLPSSAYYAPRRRYRAERLDEFLITQFRGAPPSTRVLGLTSRDISTTTERFRDWGILGLADDVPGRAAVVSSFRVRRRARSPEHALWRLTTTAVHEMGHVLGLPHCTEASCLMRDAEGTMDTVDAGDGQLGPSCRARLDRMAPRTVPRPGPP